MNKNTKSVGISTSSITKNSGISSSNRLSKIENFKKDSRSVGFLPIYTSNLNVDFSVNINNSPYPPDRRKNNEKFPSFLADKEAHKNYLPLYQIGFEPSNLQPVETSSNSQNENLKPSKSTIRKIDDKNGLTSSEKEDIIKLLLLMKQTVNSTTQMELKKFSNARKKLKESLLVAETRLTQEDKTEFLIEAKRIIEIRINKELMRLEEERKMNEEVDECYFCDCWSFLFKIIILVMIVLTYAEKNKLAKNQHRYILLGSAMVLICFAIFYTFCKRHSQVIVYIIFCFECSFSAMCLVAIVDIFLSTEVTYIHLMLLCSSSIVTLAFDTLRMLWKIKAANNLKNFIPENAITATYSEMKRNEKKIENEEVLNFDILDDDYLKKAISPKSYDGDDTFSKIRGNIDFRD